MPRWFHVLLILATLILGAVGVSRLSWQVEILDLLPRGLPGLEGTRLLRDAFQKADELIITVEAPTSALAQAAVDSLVPRLSGQPDLYQHIRHRPAWESDPQEFAEMAAYAWWNAPPGRTEALTRRLSSGQITGEMDRLLEKLATSTDGQDIALGSYDPLGLTSMLMAGLDPSALQSSGGGASEFSSGDGTFRLIYLDPAHPAPGYRETHAWLTALRADLDGPWRAEHPEFAPVRLGLTGEPAFRAEIATGMESDMKQSIGGITFIVGFLFWLLHRTLKPLLLLMAAILCANLLALGVAGLLYGSLNVMSMGFAAILTGMIEDFGVIGLHDSLDHPREKFRAILRRVLPGIFWSAVTTACIFASLGLSALPGISQLGILTALGILIGAGVMLFGFLPLAMRWNSASHARPPATAAPPATGLLARAPACLGLFLLIAAATTLALRGLPPVHRGSSVMRPTNSPAFAAFETLQARLQPADQTGEWLPLILTGTDEASLARTAAAALAEIKNAQSSSTTPGGEIKSFLPVELIPQLDRQTANRPALAALAAEKSRLTAAVTTAGFNDTALALDTRILDLWAAWSAAPPTTQPRWPADSVLRSTLGKFLQNHPGHPTAAGFLRVPTGARPSDQPLVAALEKIPGVHPAGWSYLGEKLEPLLQREATRVCLPAAAVLFILLFFVFKNWHERLLALASLAFSALLLLAAMQWLHQSWNFISLAAIPLSLGLGLDFTIHMIYSLRRLDGPDAASSTGLGRALAYCGLSTGLGFGSLAFSGNAGLSSLGWCAMCGVLATLFTAAFLLPIAWQKTRPAK